jgi:hypothetical protein
VGASVGEAVGEAVGVAEGAGVFFPGMKYFTSSAVYLENVGLKVGAGVGSMVGALVRMQPRAES